MTDNNNEVEAQDIEEREEDQKTVQDHPMTLRTRPNVDYATLHRTGRVQFAQKMKIIRQAFQNKRKKFKIRVRDAFRRIVDITMTHQVRF